MKVDVEMYVVLLIYWVRAKVLKRFDLWLLAAADGSANAFSSNKDNWLTFPGDLLAVTGRRARCDLSGPTAEFGFFLGDNGAKRADKRLMEGSKMLLGCICWFV